MRFVRAVEEGNSLFRSWTHPKPHSSPTDIFPGLARAGCLREHGMVNACPRIPLFGWGIKVPKAPFDQELELRLLFDEVN
ncbi:MAG: hypothetical protein ABSG98_03730 [Anaerolineales bacterium]|jgi:hypothetical protein